MCGYQGVVGILFQVEELSQQRSGKVGESSDSCFYFFGFGVRPGLWDFKDSVPFGKSRLRIAHLALLGGSSTATEKRSHLKMTQPLTLSDTQTKELKNKPLLIPSHPFKEVEDQQCRRTKPQILSYLPDSHNL